MKKYVKITLLFCWFAAIMAPSVITILDWDSHLVVYTIGEEEQKEQEKKDPTEEKIAQNNSTDFSLIAQSKKSSKGDLNNTAHNDYTVEILLPPPEHSI